VPVVIQIRDVPDDVRDALARAAEAKGMSLTSYVRRELEYLAGRERRVADNAEVIRETRRRVGGAVDRETILTALHAGRDER
jgi:hypothetical protein